MKGKNKLAAEGKRHSQKKAGFLHHVEDVVITDDENIYFSVLLVFNSLMVKWHFHDKYMPEMFVIQRFISSSF